LGATRSEQADVRIIVATNKDLAELTRRGAFREDLYYRINVVRIALPELKDRREDIPLLVAHFIRKLTARMGRQAVTISDEVMDVLMSYEFPGNIRELENIIERMLVVSTGDSITMRHLPRELVPADVGEDEYASFKEEITGSEKKMIQEVLNRYRGNRGLAARALNINRTTLWRKMQKHHLFKNKE
jgi:transcriptional regulator with PAS, ATPase and Fis domain